jgi:nicotinamide mononucleotide adenylyltransferase
MVSRISQGIVHGRFQPFHNDHLKYCIDAKKHCDFLWIGLTQFDINSLAQSPKDKHRQAPKNNPLTYFERLCIIQASLVDAGLSKDTFSFIPFPIENPSNLHCFAPLDAPIFTTINDQWNEFKIKVLEKAGFKVIVLWKESKKFEGAKIRKMVLEGDIRWKTCVPRRAAKILEEIGFKERLETLVRTK